MAVLKLFDYVWFLSLFDIVGRLIKIFSVNLDCSTGAKGEFIKTIIPLS